MSQGSDAADVVPESADVPRASTAAAVPVRDTASGRRRVGRGDMAGPPSVADGSDVRPAGRVVTRPAGGRADQPVEQAVPLSAKFAGAGLLPFQEPLNPMLVLPPVPSEPL